MLSSGYIKNKDPLTGFENFETDSNGVVYVCGGDSGRVIKPGVKGAVLPYRNQGSYGICQAG